MVQSRLAVSPWTRKAVAFVGLLVMLGFGAGIGDPISPVDLLRAAPAFVLIAAVIYLVV